MRILSTTPESENLRAVERVGDTGTGGAVTRFQDQYVSDMFNFHQGAPDAPTERTGDRTTPPSGAYDFHQGEGDKVGPPAPERTSDRNTFETVRNARGEVDSIKFGDGTTMMRTGPKEWQVMRNNQPLNPQELQAFAGANAMGFPLAVREGKILGNITQKDAGGDIQYDARNTELNIYVTRKPDGSRDLRNYNDYSRTKIGADGREQDKDYWDGYQWRHGTAERLPGGQVQITFRTDEQPSDPSKPRPQTVVRDASSDALTVKHNDQMVMHANWREQKLITRNANQPEDVKYYDGEAWRHGKESPLPGGSQSANLRRVEFDDGTGPQSVVIDVTTGEIKEKVGRMEQQRREEQPVERTGGRRPVPQCGPQGCNRGGQPMYYVPQYVSPCSGGRCYR